MWKEQQNSLVREFEFRDFDEAISFVNRVADIARKLDHHPHITNEYNKVSIRLRTHDAGNTVGPKDHQMAKEIDSL